MKHNKSDLFNTIYTGFSLRSSMSTSIVIDPQDMRVEALKKWCTSFYNFNILYYKQNKLTILFGLTLLIMQD